MRRLEGKLPKLMDDILCEGAGCIRRGGTAFWYMDIHDLQLLMQETHGPEGRRFRSLSSSVSIYHSG